MNKELMGALGKLLKDNRSEIVVAKEGGTRPLSFNQLKIWNEIVKHDNGALFNVPFAIRLQGTLNQDAFEKALVSVINSNDALRTFFTKREAVLQVAPLISSFPLKVIKLPDNHESLAATALQVARDLSQTVIDLSSPPLFRVRLLNVSVDDTIVVFVFHHIVFDGVSFGLFMRELELFYNALVAGKPPFLGERKRIGYSDYAAWQHDNYQGRLPGLRESWSGHLQGTIPKLDFGTHSTSTLNRAERIFSKLSEEHYQRIRTLSSMVGTSSFVTCLSMFSLCLYKLTKQSPFVVSVPFANRVKQQTKSIIGYFTNLIPIEIRLEFSGTFSQLMQVNNSSISHAFMFQDTPHSFFESLPALQGVNHKQVMVAQLTGENNVKLDGVESTMIDVDNGLSYHDLMLFFKESKDGLVIGVEYNAILFKREEIELFLARFEKICQKMAPDSTVENILNTVS